jgi:hypothetical protein
MTSNMRKSFGKNKKLPDSSNNLHDYEVASINKLNNEVTEQTIAKAKIATTVYIPKVHVPIDPPPPPGDSRVVPITPPKKRTKTRTKFTSYKVHHRVFLRANRANKVGTTSSSTLKSKRKSMNA